MIQGGDQGKNVHPKAQDFLFTVELAYLPYMLCSLHADTHLWALMAYTIIYQNIACFWT